TARVALVGAAAVLEAGVGIVQRAVLGAGAAEGAAERRRRRRSRRIAEDGAVAVLEALADLGLAEAVVAAKAVAGLDAGGAHLARAAGEGEALGHRVTVGVVAVLCWRRAATAVARGAAVLEAEAGAVVDRAAVVAGAAVGEARAGRRDAAER